MVKKSEAITHLKSEVNKSHDFDGVYGSQYLTDLKHYQ